MSSPELSGGDVVEGTGGDQLVDGPGAGLHRAVLSSARWMAMPTSPISSPMPETASPMRVWASAAV